MENSLSYLINHQIPIYYTILPLYTYNTPIIYGQHSYLSSIANKSTTNQNTQNNNNNSILEPQPTNISTTQSNNHFQIKFNKNIRKIKCNKSKLIQSAKKNCQSNITNQIFNFLRRRSQSQQILNLVIKKNLKDMDSNIIQKLKQCFYNILGLLYYNREKKYMNHRIILCLCREEDILERLQNMNGLQLQNIRSMLSTNRLCSLYRICIMYYLKNMNHIGILTSKKIRDDGKRIHLKRRREIIHQIILFNKDNDLRQEQ